jgi:antitoxin component YwqK of YwqJK toxin-antitoxin module
MPAQRPRPKPHVTFYKDGSVWAKGQKLGDVMTGYWEFFNKDGSRMGTGSFDDRGQKVGEWTRYDKKGKVVKVTTFKPKAK